MSDSGRAVDGIPDTNIINYGCAMTRKIKFSWWRVDLGSDHPVPVSEVHIVNRFSTSSEVQKRSEDYKITLGEYILC